MSNLYVRMRKLFPEAPLLVGEVVSVTGGVALVELPEGGRVSARGDTTVGSWVFVKGGAIQGPAPSLPVEFIEV